MNGAGHVPRAVRVPAGALRMGALALGPVLALAAYASSNDTPLTPPGRATLAVAAWMAAWWLTEAVPLAATAMLPLALFPLLGIGDAEQTAAPYASSIVFLFLGGFVLGLGMQRWGLHRRLALVVLAAAGNRTRTLIGAFMLVTALLSMWISNTATVIMLLPIVASLLAATAATVGGGEQAPDLRGAGAALMLGLAYAASIGGVATLIGTPPNLIVAATGLSGLSDPVVAMICALALFAIPVTRKPWTCAMDWATARELPWDILLLFGGGLTLAAAISRHGVDHFLASGIASMAGAPAWLVVLAVAALVVFLTEVTSNTAVTATLLPVIAASAAGLGLAPGPLLTAVAISASCAFMLPVATPPNAIVLSSGQVTMAQMARAGFALNLVAIAVITTLVSLGSGDGLTRH